MVHALNQDDMTKATVDSFVPKKLRDYNNKKKEKRRRDSTGESGIGKDKISNSFSIYLFDTFFS